MNPTQQKNEEYLMNWTLWSASYLKLEKDFFSPQYSTSLHIKKQHLQPNKTQLSIMHINST